MDVVTGKICYERRDEIGAGEGMNSKVFLAWDPQRKGTLVIKEVPKAKFGNDPVKYYAEAELMFAAQHTHVVPTHYACETDDLVCIAMPYFAAGSLTKRTGGRPLPVVDTLKIAHSVLLGVGQIHAAKLLHLDIKPTNVLFDDTERPLVADFGQARRIDTNGVAKPGGIYTLNLTPELLQGVATVETDLYQVGLLLYRCVNGDHVFHAQARALQTKGDAALVDAVKKGRFPDRNVFLPHVPGWLRTCIRKAIRPEVTERHHSASEFARALANIEVVHNWQIALNGTTTTWRAERQDAPALVVRRVSDGAAWAVELFTENAGKLRAKDRAKWRKGLDQNAVDGYLTELFDALG